jgi:hypothetical protein
MVEASSNVQAKYPATNSVEVNKPLYTECQIMRAKMARHIYHSLGTPSINDFKAILKMNAIRNLPITIKDIQLAEQIFGSDIGSLKGKTTRHKPSPLVSSDYIEIPQELINNCQDIIFCMDGMMIGISFLAAISCNLMYCTSDWIESKTIKAYRSIIDNNVLVFII